MIVGIDLGTTNSLIGVMDSGFPVLFTDPAGRRLTPSVVYFPEEGEPVVGYEALRYGERGHLFGQASDGAASWRERGRSEYRWDAG